MTQHEFTALIDSETRPVILDIWAPWCGPCKAMKPIFDALAEEYDDRARVVAVNADESPEVAASLRVSAIPTVIVMHNGAEVGRRLGAQSETDLRAMFDAAVEGRDVPKLTSRARLVRLVGAVALAIVAQGATPQWPMYAAAGLLAFSAVHDRCPLWQGLMQVVRRVTTRSAA